MNIIERLLDKHVLVWRNTFVARELTTQYIKWVLSDGNEEAGLQLLKKFRHASQLLGESGLEKLQLQGKETAQLVDASNRKREGRRIERNSIEFGNLRATFKVALGVQEHDFYSGDKNTKILNLKEQMLIFALSRQKLQSIVFQCLEENIFDWRGSIPIIDGFGLPSKRPLEVLDVLLDFPRGKEWAFDRLKDNPKMILGQSKEESTERFHRFVLEDMLKAAFVQSHLDVKTSLQAVMRPGEPIRNAILRTLNEFQNNFGNIHPLSRNIMSRNTKDIIEFGLMNNVFSYREVLLFVNDEPLQAALTNGLYPKFAILMRDRSWKLWLENGALKEKFFSDGVMKNIKRTL